jgi:hypothetical protein
MDDIFTLESQTEVRQDNSYILSYPHILSFFAGKSAFTATDFVVGAHMIYGWVPTALDLYAAETEGGLDFGAGILTRAKNSDILADDDIKTLAKLVNNSLVGASSCYISSRQADTQFGIRRFLHLYSIKIPTSKSSTKSQDTASTSPGFSQLFLMFVSSNFMLQ